MGELAGELRWCIAWARDSHVTPTVYLQPAAVAELSPSRDPLCMFLRPIDLTTALRPSLLPEETLLFVQDAVGLYEG